MISVGSFVVIAAVGILLNGCNHGKEVGPVVQSQYLCGVCDHNETHFIKFENNKPVHHFWTKNDELQGMAVSLKATSKKGEFIEQTFSGDSRDSLSFGVSNSSKVLFTMKDKNLKKSVELSRDTCQGNALKVTHIELTKQQNAWVGKGNDKSPI